MHKLCAHCFKRFWARYGRMIYCGPDCRQDAYVERRRNGEIEEIKHPFDQVRATTLAAHLGHGGLGWGTPRS